MPESLIRDMRILWIGVAAWAPSGYGIASNNVIPKLQALGAKVWLHTFYGLQGTSLAYKGIPHLGTKRGSFGEDVIADYVDQYRPDVAIMLYDQWPLGGYQEALGDIYLPWVVLHYDPMEPPLKAAVENTWRQFALCDRAAEIMKREGLNPRTVPLGVDTSTYLPLIGKMDMNGEIVTRDNLKAQFSCHKDRFLVGMVAANRDFRKALEPQLRVFRDFSMKYKDDVQLFMKTNPSPAEGGWDLVKLVNKLWDTKKEGDRSPVFLTADDMAEYPPDQLCLLYNSFDVYLGAAMSEGFGIPLLEANACGCPVITTDFLAMPQAGGVGWHLPYDKVMTPLYSYGARVDEQALYLALEDAFQKADKPEYETMRQQARAHALKYDWDNVVYNIMQKELLSWYEDKPL